MTKKPKLYSVDVVISATAFIRATSAKDARAQAAKLHGRALDVTKAEHCEIAITSLPAWSPLLPNISLGTSMAVLGLAEDAVVEEMAV